MERSNRLQSFLTAGLATLTLAGSAAATHISTSLDVGGYRNNLPNQGYLQYQQNPFVTRYGDEWTGWVDVRNPSLAGATDTAFGYDRSDRYVNVRSTILTDSANVTAPSDRVTDFDYANKAYMLQSGVSIIENATRNVTSNAGTPFTFNLTPADRVAISTAYNAAAPQIELYYGRNAPGLLGATRIPTNGTPYVFLDNTSPQTGYGDTFAHEMYHFLGDGQAVHQPNGGDPGHSTDPRNIVADGSTQWSPGMPQNALGAGTPPWAVPTGTQVVGPTMSTGGGGAPIVGGVDQLTSAQAERIFSNAGVQPWFPNAQRGDNENYGDRVDWNFVVDHGQKTVDGKTFGVEGLGSGADNHQGLDSLYWGIGTTTAASEAGKDKTGLGAFQNVGDFAGPTFQTADVFSLSLRYSDSDITGAGGGLSLREGALDYDLFFRGADNNLYAGIPITVFIGGWTGNSFADDYLARWVSPVPAVGVLILANLSDADHDGTTQIDAVIVSANALPEPSTVVIMAIGVVGLGIVARREKRRRV